MAVSDTQSGVNKIIWYYKLSTDSTYKNATDSYTAFTANTSKSHRFTGLTQNKTYNAYAVVYDATGRTTQSTTINVITGTVPTASGATYTPNTWTKGNVTVTLPTKSGYSTVYTTNGTAPTKDSTKYSAAFTVSNNCKINYLYTDGTNIGGAGTVNIGNIDNTAPVLSEIKNSTNGNWTNDKVVLSWTITENGSGIEKVEYSSDGTSWKGQLGNAEWYGLTRNNARNDKLYFRVIDKVGNISNVKGTTLKIDKTAPTINSLTSANWTNSQNGVVLTAKATDSYSGISYYQFSTASNLTANSTGWNAINNTTSQITETYSAKSDNTTYYFYVKDAANNVTKTTVVAKLDKVAPTISTDLSVTTDKIATNLNLSMGITDSASGLSKITWYYKKSTDKTYTSVTDTYTTMNGAAAGTKTAVTKTRKMTGLTSDTSYNVYAVAYDVAGNKKQSSTRTVTPIAVAEIGTVKYSKLEYAVATANNIKDNTDMTTINMISNTNEVITINKYQNISLNLNSKDITTHIHLYGKLIVNGDGKLIAKKDDTNVISSIGTLEIKGGTIEGNDKGSALLLYDNSTTIISGGKISSRLGTIDDPVCAIKAYNTNKDINVKKINVTITGGEITSSGSCTIENYYSYMTITGGSITNTGEGQAISNLDGGNLEIKNGTITGNSKASKVLIGPGSTTTISGGKIINNANITSDSICAVKAYKNDETNNENPAKINITGGEIIATGTSYAIQNGYANMTITGGTISNSGGGITIHNYEGNLKINMSSGTISSNSKSNPTIHNTIGGVFTFTKGTIRNTANYYCYYNDKTKTGVKGGTWKQ